jgi:amino acid adenylation domain-containing protein
MEIHIPSATTAKLEEVAQQHRLTMSCIVQGAWALLLSRLSGDTDVMFGSTVSGRPPELDGVESIVGVFINALPVRVQVPPTEFILPWLQKQMVDRVEREQHSYNSLVQIQGWSEIRSGTSLFESLVIFENYPLRGSESRLNVEDVRLFRRTNYPLTLEVVPGTRLKLAMNFDISRFPGDGIVQTLQCLRLLLEQIASHPERRLCQLTLLTSEEHDRIAKWNDTKTAFPPHNGTSALFEEWACRYPDSIALAFDGRLLTYGELNAHANQMARYLRAYGVGPETLVATFFERSIEMIVTILGIFKAGGAYLPLDPGYPADRLAYMIEDSAVPLIIAQDKLESRIPSAWAQVVLFESEWRDIKKQADGNLSPVTNPDNLAYVIYTSGSTGRPKGVLVNHRGLCNLAQAQRRLLSPGPGSHVLQFASLSFDASAWEIVMALCSGATLHLAASDDLLPGPMLAETLAREAISHATLPPSALELMPDSELPDLQTLIVAGEACGPEIVARWSRNRVFVNAYGPTESTVCATMWACEDERLSPPIGLPLPNARAYVLDAQLTPIPVRHAGEVYLGGENLARGYLRRPGLTAERFLPDPVSGESGARLYKTGDIARYRPDGAIAFIGRGDHQVKIRGHRVELGEVEAALSELKGVRQAVVVARGDAAGASSLAAYVVAYSNAEPIRSIDPVALRRRLQQRLPEYMIPSFFVQIDSLPLTPNGKVDRQALSSRGPQSVGSAPVFRPPRDIFEQRLARIWEEVLDVSPIGVDDDFFVRGGHSLLAVRLMAGIEREFGKHLPLAALFKSPSVGQLAAALREKADGPAWSSLVAIQSAGTQQPIFFVPGGGGNVVYLYALARQLKCERPFYGLQALGLNGRSTPHGSIEEMAAAYIAEVQELQPRGPYCLGGHSSGGWVAFEMARQLRGRGEEVEMVIVVDTPAPISRVKTQDVDSDEALYLFKVARLIERWAGKDLGISYEVLQGLSVNEQIAYLGEHLKGVDILPPEASRVQVLGLVQVFKASTRNCMKYRPQALYHGDLTLLRATNIHVDDTGIQINLISDDDTWGWNQLVDGQVHVRIVPGDHITMLAEPHVGYLARELSTCLSGLEASSFHANAGGGAAL